MNLGESVHAPVQAAFRSRPSVTQEWLLNRLARNQYNGVERLGWLATCGDKAAGPQDRGIGETRPRSADHGIATADLVDPGGRHW
jgi:hypothetical protein